MLGTSDWAGKGIFGDELDDLRLDFSGFNTVGDLVNEGEFKGEVVRGKGTAIGESSAEDEPSSSSSK